MKVKNNCPEYKDYKSEKQLLKENMIIIDRSKAVELWSNQFCRYASFYAAPDNVRPMTDKELSSWKEKQKQQRKLQNEKRKEEKLYKERQVAYANELREQWHTQWQWLRDYSRIVKDNADFKEGETLNKLIGKDWYIFGADYVYFNIKDTVLITDQEELKRLIQESNDRYNGNKLEASR